MVWVDEDIVEVDGNGSLGYEVAEEVVHHVLEGGGEFVRLKNITRGSKRPQLVLNAALYPSPSFILTLL